MSDGPIWDNNDRTRDVANAFNVGLDNLSGSIGKKPNLITAPDSQSETIKTIGDIYDKFNTNQNVLPVLPEIVDGLVNVGEVSAKHENLSMIDERTGLLSLRGYNRALQEKISVQRRHNFKSSEKEGLRFIFFDSIGLKKINDKLGKPYGDVAIQIMADHLKHNTRGGEDILARDGGDEFILVETVKTNDQSSNEKFLSRINEGILTMLVKVFGQKYIDNCDGSGVLRGEGFYLSPEDLEMSSEELAEKIESKITVVSMKMENTKRRG